MFVKPKVQSLTILVDMDDTITDLLGAWIGMLNRLYGTNVMPEDVRQWNIVESFPSLTKGQVFAPLMCDSLWNYVHPKEGAVETLKQFIIDGHRVFIVTTSTYETLRAKMDVVLFHYFPFLSWENVIITGNKQMIKGDVLIDDGIHNLIGGDYVKILVDAPHNRWFNAEENGIIRVNSWAEIYREVCKISTQSSK